MAPAVAAEPKKGTPGDKIVLLSFLRRPACVLSGTPFAGKVEMALRMADLPFEGRQGNPINKSHAPKCKVGPRSSCPPMLSWTINRYTRLACMVSHKAAAVLPGNGWQ